MPVFARDILKVDASGYGSLMAAAGVGALMGAIGLAALGQYGPKGRLLTAGNLLFPATLLAFSLSRWYPLSLLILVAVGWSMVTQNATTNTLLQTTVPDHLRGRVMSVYILMFQGMMPFGSLQAGAVANAVGAPSALCLGAIIAAGYALLVFWRRPQVRRLQ
ncbi:MAG: MFS transporter [Chloroflexi bacterium]|nr:MFS transporter [Chloroflexota bacterium]